MNYDELMNINIPEYYWYLDSLRVTDAGLSIVLSRLTYGKRGIIPKKTNESWFDIFNDKNRVALAEIHLLFEDFTSYSIHNESYYSYEDDEMIFDGFVFQKAIDSKYLIDIRKHSFREYISGEKLVHYRIFTCNELIDIATDIPPIVEIVKLDDLI